MTRTSGDQQFFEELPPVLEGIGQALLKGIRRDHTGELRPTSKIRKYLETPDNFFSLTIQPRAQSVAITVYGTPEKFHARADIALKSDWPGHSRFTVSRMDQVPSAVSTIRQAHELKANR